MKILYVYNLLLVLFANAILFAVSIFWLGGKEDHEQAIANNPIGFFFGRLTMSLIASLGIALIIFVINLLYKFLFGLTIKNGKLIKISLIELIIFALASIAFVIVGIS